MSRNTADSPTIPEAKRPRSYSSPNSVADGGNERVGDMTQGQLMSMLMTSLSDLFDQKQAHLATKEDMELLSGKVNKLEEENCKLRDEIKALRVQERNISDKLLDLESRSRRNNLLFKGLKWNGNNPDCKHVVQQFCNEVLGAENKVWINRAHLLGQNSRIIIAHIPNDADIEYIMRQARQRLRGTEFMVHRDYPLEIREKRRCLIAVQREVERVAGRRQARLYHDHLNLDGCRLTWNEGQLMAGQQSGAEKLETMFKHDFKGFLETLRQPEQQVRRKTVVHDKEVNGATSNSSQVLNLANTLSSQKV